jgi:hypothetical protein
MLKIELNNDIDRQAEWHAVPATLAGGQTIDNGKVKNYFTSGIKH